MSDTSSPENGNGRATIREVFALVGQSANETRQLVAEVRAELGGKIDQLAATVAANTAASISGAERGKAAHETLSGQVGRHETWLSRHDAALGDLTASNATETALQRERAQERERRKDWHRWVVPTFLSGLYVVVTLLQGVR